MFRASGIDREPGESHVAMVAVPGIEPVKRTAKPGSRPCGPSTAFFSIHLKLRNIVASKLILDWSPEADFRLAENPVIPMMRACACRTRPFTAACSFKPVER